MIDIGYRNHKEWFDVFDTLDSFNRNYEYMYLNNIITKNFFMAYILFETIVYYKTKEFNHYELLDINKNTKQFVVARLGNFKVIDLEKVQDNQHDRKTIEYKLWKKAVYERDNYTCQHCGSENNLNAHHIKPYKDYHNLRATISNGIILCKICHVEEHKRMRETYE